MEKQYVFRGNASGLGARIIRPKNLVFTAAASSLSVIGGISESFVDSNTMAGGGLWGKVAALFHTSVSYDGVLSFKSARTKANGNFNDKEKAFKTVVNSVVLSLNVENRLTAGTLEGNLISTHPDNPDVEPSIVPTGTQILDLRADNFPINFSLDLDLFTKYPTKASLAQAYATDNAFYEKYGKRFQKSVKDKSDSKSREIPTVSGFIVTSIVSNVRTENPRAVVKDNVITLEDFGKIYLGELLISDAYRRLTLLRLKLGSPIEGDLACAGVETNGIILL